MPNVMAALPNICGALCSTPQSLADPTTRMPCSNAAKTRNPLKFAGVPQTRQQISAVSRPSSPYYQEIWRRYCCLTSLFPIVDTCLSSEDTARQSCAMVPKWWFLHPVFPASHAFSYCGFGLYNFRWTACSFFLVILPALLKHETTSSIGILGN